MEEKKGSKGKEMSIYERLDRYRGLSKQKPQAKYRVLYNTSGTYLCACVIQHEPTKFEIGAQKVKPKGLVMDTETYYFETHNRLESCYLSSVLNSTTIDEHLKPMQSRGRWAPRDIHKKVLELSIPQFDPSNNIHLRLAELGELCSQKIAQWVKSERPRKIKSIGVLRSKVREKLKKELEKIDSLVQEILKT